MVAQGEAVLGGVRRGIEANEGTDDYRVRRGIRGHCVGTVGGHCTPQRRLAEVEGKSDTIWSRPAIVRKRERGGSGPMYREEFWTRRLGPCA